MKGRCRELLKGLTGKMYVRFTPRGAKAIKAALSLCSGSKVLLQDMGGWMSYPKDCEKAGFAFDYIKTDDGLIPSDAKFPTGSILLITSSAGYMALQDMEHISERCKTAGCTLINDASGSIGEKEATVGDFIIGSFGKWKPIDLGKGGFIASDHDLEIEDSELDFDLLFEKLSGLKDRLDFLYGLASKVKADLKEHDIIHRDRKGTVVCVAFDSDETKDKILKYCEKNDYGYTICPRNIRVERDAVSIELKRISAQQI
ncbi:hypothetical protein COV93_07200 [Candidatus Woesearchaeota archaeon CG11_big_fil_rev_8_21_14_0_20_43_8]|nr:MAG: hypothetical protein COV93_07200 [Candidatus Woesearchaeota archaeon CG11_big_fil_rev_8_21_14_0_20_43_8]PIO05054.1 MAG: hypothetical protein COT47_06470 [Candidatus Woesearchaeota archaeon CG08_land_8_20_14_0_20_43_7]